MIKRLALTFIIIFLVFIELNRCLGVGFLIFLGITWFSVKNIYKVAYKKI